jgi:putative ABC transport system permease protein
MPPEEARRAARRKLGNPTLIREEIYRMNTIDFLETFWQDLRYGLRVLRKSPGFTCVAVLSLALGIGANTAVFSLVHAVLLRSLPYPQPQQLVRVAKQGSQADISIPEYEFWKEHGAAFASAAGDRGVADRYLVFGNTREWIKAATITADFFRTLAVPLPLGREFDPEETRATGPRAIVLSDSLWRRLFGADPKVLGRAVTLDDAIYTVVGVLPRGFWFPQSADAFVPLRPTGGLSDTGMNTNMIARLKPAISLRQAEAEMGTITEDFRRANASRVTHNYRGLMLIPYQDWLVGDVRTNLLLLFGAVALLLLIACSNLASLLLARLASRQKEIAVRLALGSSSGRLLRQFLIENLLLCIAGCLAGLLGAYWLLDGLLALIPFELPASAPIRLDLPVLAFTLGIALGTGLLFSLAPFLTAARLDVHETLKAAGRSAGAGSVRQRTRSFLVVSEVALSVTLLVAAGLLIQSLYRMHQERLGFTPRGLITFRTSIPAEQRRNAAGLWSFESSLLQRLEALPGVQSVAAIDVLPLAGWSNLPTQREGHPAQSIGGMEVRKVTPSYFEAMGIPVRRGRSFTANDTVAQSPVILVNETLARAWWPQGSPLGDHIVIGRFRDRGFPEIRDSAREVIGIVADTKTAFLKEPAWPTVYIPAAQLSDGLAAGTGSVAWIVRTNLSTGLADALRRTIAEIDPRQRIGSLRSMEEIVGSTTASSRFDAWLFAIFAALALVLTAIGVYGLLSFSVARRTNEIGTRIALGASRADVLKMILRQGVTLIAIGLIVGLAGALALTRLLASLLFGVRPTDPVSFLAVSALLLCVGILASYLPARRATKVDPMAALRYE